MSRDELNRNFFLRNPGVQTDVVTLTPRPCCENVGSSLGISVLAFTRDFINFKNWLNFSLTVSYMHILHSV